MQSQTLIFTQLVKDYMHRPKVCVSHDTDLGTAVQMIADRDANCCICVDDAGKLSGILRLKDIVGKITFQLDKTALLKDVMDTSVQTVHGDEFLYQAIARLRRHQSLEIVVVDDQSKPVGLLHLKDGYEVASSYVIDKIDRLASDGDVDNLKVVKSAQIEMAKDLSDGHIPPHEIQTLLSHINKDICARLIHNHTRNMAAEGWGEPPVDFAFIMMGSGGRGENFLSPDQDNGLILDDYPDENHTRIDHYFREMATRLCDDLDHIGFAYCRGNVMATNPLWRKTISQWKQQIHLWGRKRNHIALRLGDIFFDFDHVCGVKRLSQDLRDFVMESLSKNHFFLLEMHRLQMTHGVALGLFDRLVLESENELYTDHVNMKYHALLPLIEAVRLLALKHGLKVTATRNRLEKLHGLGVINEAECDHLINALRVFSDLLLTSQIKESERDQPLSGFVNPILLTKREKDRLIYSLKQVESFRKKLKADFTADVF